MRATHSATSTPQELDARRRANFTPSGPPVSYAPRAICVLIVLAVVLRIAFAFASNRALAHPDEHQQYLEQAVVHAHGYGVTFWEQDRHMRHPLLVATLGVVIRGLDALGINPTHQAILLRIGFSLTGLACLLAWAGRWRRAGETPAAVFLLLISVISFDVLWIQSRILSDNAMAIPLLLALLWERRWPAFAGAALAVLFAVRFQAGFWIAPAVVTFAALEWRNERRLARTVQLSCGFAAGMALLFGGEWLLYGKCSPWEYWRACISEGGAAEFRVQPWYFFLVYMTRDLCRASVLLPLGLVVGCFVERRLAICAIFFLIAHSLVGHKEMRFLWGLLPIAALLAARGFGELWKRSPRRGLWAALIVLSIAVPSAARVPNFRWSTGLYADSSRALEMVANRDDATGVVVLGVPDFGCGNHFYFRRPLPLILGPRRYPRDLVDRASYQRGPLGLDDDPNDVIAAANALTTPPNYWLVTDAYMKHMPRDDFETVSRFGDVAVLRRCR